MERLLWIHGSGWTHDSFRAQVEAFPGSDALSLPGHPEGEPLTSVGAMADWLGKYMRWKRVERPIVGGGSLGGAIAMEWALRYPADAGGLILIGTGARLRVSPDIFDMLERRWPECIDEFARWELTGAATDDLRKRFKEWHLTVGQATTRADYAACHEFDVMERLKEISAPTLIIVGNADQMTPLKYSRYLNEHIAGSKLVQIENGGHLAFAEQPDNVNAAIRDWLEALR